MASTGQRTATRSVESEPRPETWSAVIVGCLVIGFSGWALTTLPIQAGIILTAAGVLAFFGWIFTTYTHPVKSRRVIATYLVAVAFQLIHMAEEYTGGFPHEIVDLFDSPRNWSEQSFLLTFVFPVIKGGYFPGLYTAAGHLILSVLLITFLIQESRRLRSEDKETS